MLAVIVFQLSLWVKKKSLTLSCCIHHWVNIMIKYLWRYLLGDFWSLVYALNLVKNTGISESQMMSLCRYYLKLIKHCHGVNFRVSYIVMFPGCEMQHYSSNKRYSFGCTAVIWLKNCRYSVKLYPINQSIGCHLRFTMITILFSVRHLLSRVSIIASAFLTFKNELQVILDQCFQGLYEFVFQFTFTSLR